MPLVEYIDNCANGPGLELFVLFQFSQIDGCLDSENDVYFHFDEQASRLRLISFWSQNGDPKCECQFGRYRLVKSSCKFPTTNIDYFINK